MKSSSLALISFAFATSLLGCPSTNEVHGGCDVPCGPFPDAFQANDAAVGVDGGCDVPCGPFPDAFQANDAAIARDAAVTPDAFGPDAFAPSTALGDCNSNTDCPGGRCIALPPGGYRVCQVEPVPATSCESGRPDACCTSADCTVPAQCFLGPIVRSCGGAVRLPVNECATDECASNADCGTGICIPKGVTGPIARCVSAVACRADSDCTAETGGHCILTSDPCCGTRGEMACRYPTGGCSTNADCPGGHCGVSGGRSVCMRGGPICPL